MQNVIIIISVTVVAFGVAAIGVALHALWSHREREYGSRLRDAEAQQRRVLERLNKGQQ